MSLKSTSLAPGARAAVAACLVAAALAACGGGAPQHLSRTWGAPAYAIGIAAVSPTEVAVLAGQPSAKGVFVIDAGTGTVVKSFGVTAEATSISAVPGTKTLLIGVGINAADRSTGAVEFWDDGVKGTVLPMPAAVGELSTVVDGRAFALVGTRAARTAVQIGLKPARILARIPLDRLVDHLTLCDYDGHLYLMENVNRTMTVRDLMSQKQIVLPNTANDVACGPNRVLYGFVEAFASKSVAIMSFPSGLRLGSVGASLNAVDLTVMPQTGDLAILNSAGNVSTVNVVPATDYAEAVATPTPMRR